MSVASNRVIFVESDTAFRRPVNSLDFTKFGKREVMIEELKAATNAYALVAGKEGFIL